MKKLLTIVAILLAVGVFLGGCLDPADEIYPVEDVVLESGGGTGGGGGHNPPPPGGGNETD